MEYNFKGKIKILKFQDIKNISNLHKYILQFKLIMFMLVGAAARVIIMLRGLYCSKTYLNA